MTFITQEEEPVPAAAPPSKSFFIVFSLIQLALISMVVIAAQIGAHLLATKASSGKRFSSLGRFSSPDGWV